MRKIILLADLSKEEIDKYGIDQNMIDYFFGTKGRPASNVNEIRVVWNKYISELNSTGLNYPNFYKGADDSDGYYARKEIGFFY